MSKCKHKSTRFTWRIEENLSYVIAAHCYDCGERMSLGPSNDEPTAVAEEIIAAETIAQYMTTGSHGPLSESENDGFLGVGPSDWHGDTIGWHAGALAGFVITGDSDETPFDGLGPSNDVGCEVEIRAAEIDIVREMDEEERIGFLAHRNLACHYKDLAVDIIFGTLLGDQSRRSGWLAREIATHDDREPRDATAYDWDPTRPVAEQGPGSNRNLANLFNAECNAFHADTDAKEAAMDAHGYGGKPPSQLVGLSDFVPSDGYIYVGPDPTGRVAGIGEFTVTRKRARDAFVRSLANGPEVEPTKASETDLDALADQLRAGPMRGASPQAIDAEVERLASVDRRGDL